MAADGSLTLKDLRTVAAFKLINEPAYTFGSADNPRRYAREVRLKKDVPLTSVHGLLIQDVPILVAGSPGGASGIHTHSLLQIEQTLYFAVGQYVCRFKLGEDDLTWAIKVDEATCFGVHHSDERQAFISHGELEIVRFSPEGTILWASGSADIFSERIHLKRDYIEAVDFEGRIYHFNYETGDSAIVKGPDSSYASGCG